MSSEQCYARNGSWGSQNERNEKDEEGKRQDGEADRQSISSCRGRSHGGRKEKEAV